MIRVGIRKAGLSKIALMLTVLSVMAFQRPQSAKALPDTSNGIGRGIVSLRCVKEFNWSDVSPACAVASQSSVSTLENKISTGWTVYNAPILNFVSPALASKVGISLQIMRSPGWPFDYSKFNSSDWRSGNSPQTFDWWKQNHPDWIAYKCDRTVAWQYNDVPKDFSHDPAYVPLDISNPDVRQYYWATYVQPAIDHGAPLVFFDNLTVYNAFGVCGHYDAGGNWVSLYTSSYQDAAFQEDALEWLEWLYSTIKSYKPSVTVAVNYNPAESNDATATRDRVLNSLDMVFHEAGFNYWGQHKSVDDVWQRILDMTQAAQSHGKAVFNSETAMVGDPSQISHDDKNWGLANYLLFKGSQDYLAFAGSTCTTCTSGYNYNDYGYYIDMPEFDANLGAAKGPMYQSQGVYMRDFQNGKVIVNPNSTSSYNLSLDQSYHDLWGQSVGPEYSIQTQSAVVLLD